MDNSRLKIRRIINYEPDTKSFSMSISFGGFLLYTAVHFTSYLAADAYYNRMLTNMEAIFNNLAEASKLSFTSPDGDVTGTIDPNTLEVEYDQQTDDSAEADEWEARRVALETEIHDDELQEIARELVSETDHMPGGDDFSDDMDPEDTDEPYEPYERIHEPYDPIRYE